MAQWMQRREFTLGLCCLAMAPCVRKSSDPLRGPLFWLATRANARVFILGFADANDESWLTPPIRRALQESSELWLEVAPDKADSELLDEIGQESGRTFFDELEPSVRERTLAYMGALGIKSESIETQRPWRAFYTINSAFWSQNKLPYEPVYPDQVLRELAQGEGKSIHYEMPTADAFARFMSGMPDMAQSQYIEWLLDFLDEHEKGLDTMPFSWISGKPAASRRSLYRMRTKMPELYRVIQVQRNAWWARKIDGLLRTGSTYFVGVGMLHVLGPDGIPSQLRRLGVVSSKGLRENPRSSSW
jgi:uncharacterized protein YbaP (TraB family)